MRGGHEPYFEIDQALFRLIGFLLPERVCEETNSNLTRIGVHVGGPSRNGVTGDDLPSFSRR